MFQQMVLARRAKKEKWERLTEEAKAAATEENPDPQPEINLNQIDSYFFLPDFPTNADESIALNKEKYAVQLILTVKEMPVFKAIE